MTNIFSLVLVIATLATGLLWCLSKITLTLKFRKCQMLKKVRQKSGWLETCSSVFPAITVVLIVRSFFYEPFQIPSGSMMPSLMIGDFILVEKFAYGIKDPIYQKTLIKTNHPKRGDIVVFKYPEDPRLNYVKRTIGLPGDKIIYDPVKKELIIQQRCNSYIICENTLPIVYSNVKLSDFVQTFSYLENGKIISNFFKKLPQDRVEEDNIRLIERKETIGEVTYHILTSPIAQDQLKMYFKQSDQQLATWIVPSGEYFMMGDNRDNSADSRYWGFVPEANLVGKVTAIWMSFEKQEGRWPTGVRLNRIKKIY